jgi:hypothetical protein
MVDAGILDQRGQQGVVTAVTRWGWSDLDHPAAIGFVRLVELLDESEGQPSAKVLVVLSEAHRHFFATSAIVGHRNPTPQS